MRGEAECACVALVHGGTSWRRRAPDLNSLGGRGRTPHLAPRMMPSPHWKRYACVYVRRGRRARSCWRVDGGGMRARGWCGSVRNLLTREGGVWQCVRVSRWCMAAHAGDGGRPFSRVSAGKRLASYLAPRMMPSPHWKRYACACGGCWRVDGGGMRERVSRWCMAAYAGNGGSPISTVSAGKHRAPHPAPRMMPSPY